MKNLLQIIKTSFLAAPFTLFIQHVKAAEKPKVGDTAPTATLSDDNGNPLNLEKNFQSFLNWVLDLRKELNIPHKLSEVIDIKKINKALSVV